MRNRIGRDNLTQWSIKNELRWQSLTLVLSLSLVVVFVRVCIAGRSHEFFIARALVVGEENELSADVHYCEVRNERAKNGAIPFQSHCTAGK